MKVHEKYINRCLQLAKNGLGTTYPNPLVGSVIVYNDRIIGEGWHQKAGEPHAEVNAINSVKDESLLKKATIYVSLEPCSHYGKTPPCSDLIISQGIKSVIIGTIDPFAKVAGRGIKKLMEAGCDVQVGILEKQCKELNKRFFTFHQEKRPYIILKWAQTANGYIAPNLQEKREPVWISNAYSKQLVHKWRSEEQSILVGTATAIADNPKLNTRLWQGSNSVRLVIDRNLKIPKESALLDGSIKTIVFTKKNKVSENEKLIFEQLDFSKNLPTQICEKLYQHQLQSVIIEGGAKTLQHFIDAKLWDEARVYTGSAEFKEGIKAPNFSGKLKTKKAILKDTLKTYRND